MPLLPASIKSFIVVKASSKLIAGDKFPDFVTAIANGAAQYILTASTVNSTNIALGPGSGTQTGTIAALNPTAMSNAMKLKTDVKGLSGRDIKKVLDAVSFGVVNAMKSVILQGTIIGAGPGTGTGKITGLSATALKATILNQSFFREISGNKLESLMNAISSGITSHIMQVGVVNVTNIGIAASPPLGPVTLTVPGIGRLV